MGINSKTTTFLKPEHLSSVSSLSIRAKHIVEGLIAGMHRSPLHGFSSEFLEYRSYRQGEPASKIDWRKYAKSGKNFVRLFEDETNLTAKILLDKSASMEFSSEGEWTKFEYAKTIAAAISWILIRQRDAVGVSLFDSKIDLSIRAGSTNTKLKEIISKLENSSTSKKTNCAKSINRLASLTKKRGMTILISDLFDNEADILQSLRHLKFNGQDVVVVRVLDKMEREFSFNSELVITDLENGSEFRIDGNTATDTFSLGFKNHNNFLKRGCAELGIEYIVISTDMPFAKALVRIVEKRN